MLKLRLNKFVYPESPVVGTSTRRNCPCCEETFNFASLDVPSPIVQKRFQGKTQVDNTENGYRVLFKSYSSGSILKVVRRKPVTPFSISNASKITLDDTSGLSRKHAKKLSVTRLPISTFVTRKNIQYPTKEKELNLVKVEENTLFTQSEIEKLWKLQDKKIRTVGGLNKVQKVLRRANLPPLATSIKELRFRKLNVTL